MSCGAIVRAHGRRVFKNRGQRANRRVQARPIFKPECDCGAGAPRIAMKGDSRFRCGRAPNHNRSPILRRQAQACPELSAAGALRRLRLSRDLEQARPAFQSDRVRVQWRAGVPGAQGRWLSCAHCAPASGGRRLPTYERRTTQSSRLHALGAQGSLQNLTPARAPLAWLSATSLATLEALGPWRNSSQVQSGGAMSPAGPKAARERRPTCGDVIW